MYKDSAIVIAPEIAVDMMTCSNSLSMHGLQQQCEVLSLFCFKKQHKVAKYLISLLVGYFTPVGCRECRGVA